MRRCAADVQSDPAHCGACGLACAYPLCHAGSCVPTRLVPTPQLEPVSGNTDYMAVYMRRMIGLGSGIAGVGINSTQVGERLRLFVAADEAGEPTVILALGEVTVSAPASWSDAARPRGTELVFSQPLVLPRGAPFWIGFAATDRVTVETAIVAGGVDDRLADELPELGQRFASYAVMPAQLSATPSIYAVIFDP
jgi:hypothetical protein